MLLGDGIIRYLLSLCEGICEAADEVLFIVIELYVFIIDVIDVVGEDSGVI